MTNHLVISALGDDRPGIVKNLSKQILDAGGNLTDSRMSVLGEEFAVIMLVSGSSSIVDKIKALLPQIEVDLGLTIISKETKSNANAEPRIPYLIEIVAMDNLGIVHEVTEFLSHNQVNVEDLRTSSYPAAHTGTIMFSMDLSISVPANLNVSSLKSTFIEFCDDLNLDVTIVVQ